MLVGILASSRKSCIGLVAALQHAKLGYALQFAQQVPGRRVETSGGREIAIVYSIEESTPEPLTPQDCLKLLKPLARELVPPKSVEPPPPHYHNSRTSGQHHTDSPGRTPTRIRITGNNRQFFR